MTGTDEREALARFAALLDAYGAEARRWPPDRRESALALLARSTEARRLHGEAGRLDEWLDVAQPAAAPAWLLGQVVRAAPSGGIERRERNSWLSRIWRPAMGLAMAALFGMVLGSIAPPFDNGAGADEQTMAIDSLLDTDVDAEL